MEHPLHFLQQANHQPITGKDPAVTAESFSFAWFSRFSAFKVLDGFCQMPTACQTFRP